MDVFSFFFWFLCFGVVLLMWEGGMLRFCVFEIWGVGEGWAVFWGWWI